MKLAFAELLYLIVEKLNNLFNVLSYDAYHWRHKVTQEHYLKKAKKGIEAVDKAERGTKK
jgi:hypothetical protein